MVNEGQLLQIRVTGLGGKQEDDIDIHFFPFSGCGRDGCSYFFDTWYELQCRGFIFGAPFCRGGFTILFGGFDAHLMAA